MPLFGEVNAVQCGPRGGPATWLLPVIMIAVMVYESAYSQFHPSFFDAGIFCSMICGSALWGLLGGFVIAKQFEAVFVVGSFISNRLKRQTPRPKRMQSLAERLDEASTALEAPPTYGLPRRFGIRGMLIATTWAAVLMGCLRACGASPPVYFVVLTFIAGTLAAQVILFEGRNPGKASMWVGAFLLPLEAFVVASWQWDGRPHYPRFLEELAWICAAMFAYCVPGGIILGAVSGAIGGLLYSLSEDLLVWLTREVPKVSLEPITDADADVLMAWISGPKLCRRWAGDQLAFPLDRQQLLDRFATARVERSVRCICKAVNARSGNMVGYLELRYLEPRGLDPVRHRATLELPLVDPNASERRPPRRANVGGPRPACLRRWVWFPS